MKIDAQSQVRLTEDEKKRQVLTRGRADPPFARTLAVSKPVGRGTPTSLAESVSESKNTEESACAGEPNETP